MSTQFEKDVYENFANINKLFEKMDEKFEKRFEEFDKKLEKLDTMELDIKSIKKQLVFMNEDMFFIQTTVGDMYNRISKDVPTLFDASSMHQENIESLNEKVEEHDTRISSLEQAIV